MKDIVALLTCCAMVYHYTVADSFHAHGQTPAATTNVTLHGDCCAALRGGPDAPQAPAWPHDDFHHAHGAATLVASSYSHWGAAKAPVAVLDGPIVVTCEQLGLCEPFCRDVAQDGRQKTRGDCYRGIGAFLS